MNTDAGVDVVLPAGGRIRSDFAADVGTEVKALIRLGGRTVLERTIEALRGTGRVGRVVVVGPDAVREAAAAGRADVVLPEGRSGPENLFRGLGWLREADGAGDPARRRVLLVPTDLPFLTPEAIAGFLDGCPEDADIVLPVIERAAFEARFPGSANTYVALRDGAWTLGCAFLVDPEALERNRLSLDRAFEARKSQWAMARLLGPRFVVRFLLKRLVVTDIERRCEEILHCRAAALRGCSADLAFDIDAHTDYRYAAERLTATPPPHPTDRRAAL